MGTVVDMGAGWEEEVLAGLAELFGVDAFCEEGALPIMNLLVTSVICEEVNVR